MAAPELALAALDLDHRELVDFAGRGFLLDLVLKFPFGGLSPIVDIFAVLSCGAVLYLGWDASRDFR